MMRRTLFALTLLFAASCTGTADSVLETPPATEEYNTLTNDVVAVTSGASHSCALNLDGTIACWGAPEHGITLPPYGSFSSISAGSEYTCGLRIDGTIACWGDTRWLDGPNGPTGTFIKVVAGPFLACGLRLDRTAECWGRNWYGEATPPAGTFLDISPGVFTSCGVRDGGAVECWGNVAEYIGPPPAGSFVAVRADNSIDVHCSLDAVGEVTCWGKDASSQLVTPPNRRFKDISVGTFQSCGILQDGLLACWGIESPPPAGKYIALDAGRYHTCAVRDDGAVMCWGLNNWNGQSTPPTPVDR